MSQPLAPRESASRGSSAPAHGGSTIGGNDTSRQHGQEHGDMIPKVSNLRFCLNLVLCGLGAGLLSFPWATAGAGLLNMAFWNFCSVLLGYKISLVMVKACYLQQCFEIGQLVGQCNFVFSGRIWQKTCSFAIWPCYWLGLLAFIIIIADAYLETFKLTESLFAFHQVANKQEHSVILKVLTSPHLHQRWIPITTATIIAGILSFLSQKTLALVSSLGIFANFFVLWALVWNYYVMYFETRKGQDHDWHHSGVCLIGFHGGNITYLSTVLMAVGMTPMFCSMFEAMETRTVENFAKCSRICFAILWCIFTGCAGIGYLSFGPPVQQDVLNNLPLVWYSIISRICMIIIALGCYPLMMIPMVESVKSLMTDSSTETAFFDAQQGKEMHTGAEVYEDCVSRPESGPSTSSSSDESNRANHAISPSVNMKPGSPDVRVNKNHIGTPPSESAVISGGADANARSVSNGQGRGGYYRCCCDFMTLVNVFILVSVALSAFLTSDLGVLNVINGCLSTFCFLGVFPGLIGFCLLEYAGKYMLGLALWGLVMMVLGLQYTDNYVGLLTDEHGCWWKLQSEQVEAHKKRTVMSLSNKFHSGTVLDVPQSIIWQ